ncbi:hypothetical protein DSO57_1013398 [Entomophthora muscae]|uniref:Uncharacterized protein n=1 Tax=Entomophthora muscae TaxID=34485 RepID=A0ACC2RWT1_9FUNG|nr:hypothetical protein DSO57_1013398 [Entomophthora muscae]
MEAQLAEVRSDVQEGRCRCSQAQFSASRVPHDRSGESTTLCQPTNSVYKDDTISSSLGQQSLPPVLVVPPIPEATSRPNRSESSSGASQQNFFMHTQQYTPPPLRRQNTDKNVPRLKPMNFLKFDPKGNVHTFIRFFEILMYSTNNQDKATTLLNQLDTASTDLIIPHMLQNNWPYAAAKQALLYKFGTEFADQFYLEAQVLTGSGSLTVHDAHIALCSAVKPYKALYHTLMPAFQNNFSIDGMPRFLFTPPACTKGSGCFTPKANMSKVTCHHCNCKGHCTNSCTSKTGVYVLPPQEITIQGKDQVENNLTNVLTVLPDRLPQAPERPVAPPYGADHFPDKAELFVLDVDYSGNALHHVIVEDVHLVQTRSQAKAKGKAQVVVSKPYARQLLEKSPNKGPGPSTDTLHLKGVSVAIPMDTMKAHHPKLCGSILKFLFMADDLDIHLVNKISSSYSECTYADIIVNKNKI